MLRFENHLYGTQDKLFKKSALLATKMNPPTRMVGRMRKSSCTGGIWTKWVSLEGTPSQTSMEPENHPSEKEHLPNHHFLGSMLVLGSIYLHHLPPKKPLVFCPNWIGLSDVSTHRHTHDFPRLLLGLNANVQAWQWWECRVWLYIYIYVIILCYIILYFIIYIYISCIYPFVMFFFTFNHLKGPAKNHGSIHPTW